MGFSRTLHRDTLAALADQRWQLERSLKEDAARLAEEGVRRLGDKHNWPEEDVTEVLCALGLTELNESKP